jgi:hypothetical protein
MAKTKQTVEKDPMAKIEKFNDGSMSGLKKTIIGTVGTLVTAGGAFLMTYINAPKKDDKVAQPQSININMPTQQQPAGGTKTVIIKEKSSNVTHSVTPAAKKKDGDEFKEKPAQW